jgi:hypothetical protein
MWHEALLQQAGTDQVVVTQLGETVFVNCGENEEAAARLYDAWYRQFKDSHPDLCIMLRGDVFLDGPLFVSHRLQEAM